MTESRPSNPSLPSPVDDALIAVVGALQNDGNALAEPVQVRDHMRSLCQLARSEQVPVEALVIGFKNKLSDAASFRTLASHQQIRSQAVLVSRLITIYYSES